MDIGVVKLEDLVADQVRLIIADIQKDKKKIIDPCHYVNITVANVVLRIISGVTNKWDDKDFVDVVQNTGRLFIVAGPAALYITNPIFMSLPIPQNYEIRKVMFNIFAFINKTINKHKEEYDPTTPPKDFVESYLHERQKADVST